MGGTGRTILLVEDESIIALAEARILEKFGYGVVHAISGERAVDLALSKPDIDLILMDINLGRGMDGPEAARRILRERHLPIIFLTSHAENDYVEKVRSITRYGYVIKNSGDFVLRTSIETAFELYEANRKLQDKEERLSFALDGANDGLWDITMATGEVYLSARACEILGYAEDELPEVARVWSQLVHPDDLPATEAALAGYLAGERELFMVEQRLRTKSGDYRWVLARGKAVSRDKDGAPIRMVGTHTDIHEHKMMEGNLDEKTRLFQALLEHSPVYIFFKDEDIRPIYLSRNYETMLGRPLDQILGKTMDDLFPSDLAKSMIADDKKILDKGELVQVDEHLGDRYYTTIKFPIELEGKRRLLAGFTMDITDRKLAELRLEAMLGERDKPGE